MARILFRDFGRQRAPTTLPHVAERIGGPGGCLGEAITLDLLVAPHSASFSAEPNQHKISNEGTDCYARRAKGGETGVPSHGSMPEVSPAGKTRPARF